MFEQKPYSEWTLEELHKTLFPSPGKEANQWILQKIIAEYPGLNEVNRSQVEKVITYLCEKPKEEEKNLTLRQLSEQLVDEGLASGASQEDLIDFIAKKVKEHHA